MTDTADEAIRAMSDEDLLAQINGYDPYDVEFARRFLALRKRLARVEAAGQALIATASNTGCADQRDADSLDAAITAFRKAMEDER